MSEPMTTGKAPGVRPGADTAQPGLAGLHDDQQLRERIRRLERKLGRPIRVAHTTPAKVSLDVLMANRLRVMQEYGLENYGLSGDPDFVPGANRHDAFTFRPLEHLTRSMDLGEDARVFFEYYRHFRSETYDVVTTYGFKPCVLGRIAAGLAGVPVVANMNWGLFFGELNPPARKLGIVALEVLAARFSAVTFSANYDDIPYLNIAEAGKGRGPSGKRVIYIGNATDLEHFDPAKVSPEDVRRKRESWGAGPNDVVVGMAGRLVREKGCMEFIEAARQVRTRRPEAVFVLLGPVDERKKDQLDLDLARRHLVLPGYEGDMRTALAAMDIATLPSYREGFPRTLVESCAMGLPVVTTDTRGCRQAVDYGRNGYTVPIGDADALARALEKLVADPELRRRASRHSREKALAEFDDRRLVQQMVRAYVDALEEVHGL